MREIIAKPNHGFIFGKSNSVLVWKRSFWKVKSHNAGVHVCLAHWWQQRVRGAVEKESVKNTFRIKVFSNVETWVSPSILFYK
jgi:hypothetical protein